MIIGFLSYEALSDHDIVLNPAVQRYLMQTSFVIYTLAALIRLYAMLGGHYSLQQTLSILRLKLLVCCCLYFVKKKAS